ncbi:MAG: hypothetical protein JOY51_08100 [Nevskia sp.]|nr:hypothetical protein [Nevskia sp.]
MPQTNSLRFIALFLAAPIALDLCACGSSTPVAGSAGGGGAAGNCAAPTLPSYHSLYSGPAPRPGPDLLYQPLADAPQLQNTGVWQAPPILVSGASAYRACEFLYQDYLYDDHGARQLPDPTDPLVLSLSAALAGSITALTDGSIFALPNGTYTYPTAAGYAGNAADLVEFRVKPLADATAFRITLNTLNDPALPAFTLALGGTAGSPVNWPHGANVSSPAALFLTVHGSTAELLNADGSAAAGDAPTLSLDSTRRQYTVQLPHSAWNPGRGTVRMALGVGLWDQANAKYLLPGAVASATAPGGAGVATAPAAFFNLAFRYSEPFPTIQGPVNGVGAELNPAFWRDQAQGVALASGDISDFFASVDFGKLADGVNDDMPDQPTGVPQSGAMDRILASHFETAQGLDFSVLCGSSASCKGEYLGRLQPYAIYVPKGAPPAGGWGLQLLLHSLSANYNQFESSRNQSQFSQRGAGYVVITPEGRGADGWYYDYAGADTWEVWADAAARYPLDPAATDIAGYSMGGYGTYKFSTQFPDLFAKAQPTVGPPAEGIWVPPAPPSGGDQSNTNRMLASLRNIPYLIWDEATDELVPVAGVEQQAQTFGSLGYRYEFDLYTVGEHLTLAVNDQYAPAAAFLATDRVDSNPFHVSYVYNPTMDFASLGTASGHAYWVSNVVLRDASGTAPLGTVDVRSEGFGLNDPTPSGVSTGAGVLQGGAVAPLPYVSQTQTWGTAPAAPVADTLDITTSNVSSLTVDPARAKVDCQAKLNVSSDGPLKVILSGC